MRLLHAVPEHLRPDHDPDAYYKGEAIAMLCKAADAPQISYGMSGRLIAKPSGWVMLEVPNALVNGAFDSLDEAGIELPPAHGNARYQAHISVMRPEEVEQIGGIEKITERGHRFHYTLGPLQTTVPHGWAEMSKVWFIKVKSPELETFRKSYGLPNLPNEGKFEFHITVAVRRKSILRPNDRSKAAHVGGGDIKAERTQSVVGMPEVATAAAQSLPARGGTVPENPAGEMTLGMQQLFAGAGGPGADTRNKQAKDVLPGGKADNKADSDFEASQLRKGVEHELEHTGSKPLAKEISKDHLAEDPAYYTHLDKMEEEVKKAGGVLSLLKRAVINKRRSRGM